MLTLDRTTLFALAKLEITLPSCFGSNVGVRVELLMNFF
jgi:hypothetical protein